MCCLHFALILATGAEVSAAGFTVKVLDIVDLSADITQRTMQITSQVCLSIMLLLSYGICPAAARPFDPAPHSESPLLCKA
jgi:hypothetical protein